MLMKHDFILERHAHGKAALDEPDCVVDSIPKFIASLTRHPDAARRCGDNAAGRLNGLQQVQLLADGTVVIVWSWGTRRFAAGTALEDMARYLEASV